MDSIFSSTSISHSHKWGINHSQEKLCPTHSTETKNRFSTKIDFSSLRYNLLWILFFHPPQFLIPTNGASIIRKKNFAQPIRQKRKIVFQPRLIFHHFATIYYGFYFFIHLNFSFPQMGHQSFARKTLPNPFDRNEKSFFNQD